MNNFISINISYILKTNYLERSDLAKEHSLTTSAIGTYINSKSLPNIKFIQKICKDYNISIDDFINKDLSKLKKADGFVKESEKPYHLIDKKTEVMYERILKNYEEQLLLKDQIIEEKQQHYNVQANAIEILEKNIEQKEALLNQSAQLDSLNTLLQTSGNIEKIERLYSILKLEAEIEAAKKEIKTKNP